MDDIKDKDVHNLLEYFSKVTYSAKDSDYEADIILGKCIALISLDYKYSLVNNSNGELSSHYPSKIIILEHELKEQMGNVRTSNYDGVLCNETIYESHYDQAKLKDIFSKAKFARCRGRFCVPVVLCQGKHICRSATLSGGPEIYGRSGIDFFFGNDNGLGEESHEEIPVPNNPSEWQLFDRVRSQDIRLLKTLNVVTIVDLMVEKKKVKFGMNITSSEKVDKENRYSDFKIISLPYPGCEFFKEYRDAGYTAEGLVFDWNQSFVDAHLGLPNDNIISSLSISWPEYKCWDLIQLTQNYLRLLLLHIQESPGGLLIHCISGWDRTPLFVSLVRLSLWADGLAHPSLSAIEILYFTIAYDWMLFGHNLQDRLTKGEEIMFFCFYFLKFICNEEFSVVCRQKSPRQTVLRTDSDCLLDCVLLENENHISRKGSTTSLNSCCSSVSCKSQELPPVFFNVSQDQSEDFSGNKSNASNICLTNNASGTLSSKLKETSVAVPVPKPLRNRHESSSSVSCGSWQIISGTGSLRGSTSSSGQSRGSIASSMMENMCESAESNCTLVCKEVKSTQNGNSIELRREKLNRLRGLFYQLYCSAIGFKFNNGGFSSLFENFAEKVGFKYSHRTTNV